MTRSAKGIVRRQALMLAAGAGATLALPSLGRAQGVPGPADHVARALCDRRLQ